MRLFYFYLDGQLHEGINYNNRFYKLEKTFKVEDAPIARFVGQQLAQTGQEMVITMSKWRYRLWVAIDANCNANSESMQFA